MALGTVPVVKANTFNPFMSKWSLVPVFLSSIKQISLAPEPSVKKVEASILIVANTQK